MKHKQQSEESFYFFYIPFFPHLPNLLRSFPPHQLKAMTCGRLSDRLCRSLGDLLLKLTDIRDRTRLLSTFREKQSLIITFIFSLFHTSRAIEDPIPSSPVVHNLSPAVIVCLLLPHSGTISSCWLIFPLISHSLG